MEVICNTPLKTNVIMKYTYSLPNLNQHDAWKKYYGSKCVAKFMFPTYHSSNVFITFLSLSFLTSSFYEAALIFNPNFPEEEAFLPCVVDDHFPRKPTENTPCHQGLLIESWNDFNPTSKSYQQCFVNRSDYFGVKKACSVHFTRFCGIGKLG